MIGPLPPQRLFGESLLPLIGVVHAPPLPGSPRYGGNLEAIRISVLSDAETLETGGVDGLLLENFGDAPFFPDRVPAVTVACLTALAQDLRRRSSLPLGINVLRNDGRSALAVALAAGAQFIRVNVLCGARVTDQGIAQGIAHEVLRDRAGLGARSIGIVADVNVKHSAPLAVQSLADEVRDTIQRGGADAIIVTGKGTGMSASLHELSDVRGASGATPVLIGSGVDVENLPRYARYADGFIVGTSLKVDGIVTNPVAPQRVTEFVATLRSLRLARLTPPSPTL